jgi:hypothetical protein
MNQLARKGGEEESLLTTNIAPYLISDIVPVIYKILLDARSVENSFTVASSSDIVARALERLSENFSLFDHLNIVKYISNIIDNQLASPTHAGSIEAAQTTSISETIKGDILRIVSQNVLHVLSDPDERVLLNNKFSIVAQSKRQKSGGFFSLILIFWILNQSIDMWKQLVSAV